MWELHEIQISASVNNVIGIQPCLFVDVPFVALFKLKHQGWVVVTKTLWPAKPKMFSSLGLYWFALEL